MDFELSQRIDAEAAAIASAFVDRDYYVELARLPKLGKPEVLALQHDGTNAHLEVRYRFTGDLSAAARAVLDPAKLTWVEVSDHDLVAHRISFVLKPDNYADRFSCRGRSRLDPADEDAGVTVRRTQGQLKVRAPLVAGQVERAIVSGLSEHLEAEAQLLASWLAAT